MVKTWMDETLLMKLQWEEEGGRYLDLSKTSATIHVDALLEERV